MVKITDEMKEVVQKAGIWAVGTAAQDGTPNVVSIACAKILSDNQILFMANFMNKTLDNLKANPKMAASVWDMAGMKGYQFKGEAKIETSGKIYEEGVEFDKALMTQIAAQLPPEMGKALEGMLSQLQPKAAVVLEVKEIYNLAPGPDAGKPVS